jgi:hypothetical protein
MPVLATQDRRDASGASGGRGGAPEVAGGLGAGGGNWCSSFPGSAPRPTAVSKKQRHASLPLYVCASVTPQRMVRAGAPGRRRWVQQQRWGRFDERKAARADDGFWCGALQLCDVLAPLFLFTYFIFWQSHRC